MANYYGIARTNYFRVTDEEKYKEIYEKLVGLEDDICDFSEEKEGVLYHGFGAYGGIEYRDENEEYNWDAFFYELQQILPEDEAFMYFEVGYEKLRYVVGFAYVVTKNTVKSMSLDDWAKAQAKELLGPDFSTRTDY